MQFKFLALCVLMVAAHGAHAEGGCPPGQYPIGGQGAAGCAPIPQSQAAPQEAPRPTGYWVKTWGAIAMGPGDGWNSFGVTTGKASKSEAEADALKRCVSNGVKDCRIGLSYRNQCAAVAEPQIGGKSYLDGLTNFVAAGSEEAAGDVAVQRCEQDNRAVTGMQCKVIYTACSRAVFKSY
ncbi:MULTISPECIES: DUF4189 domain-containing protein [unclassified Xanthomonas]|uniref:DUF4189 domain-containing protein n=1 Tax=unclassified Xanthomonas TaxID=2643310 RepID=UPI002A837B74|nr:MULTISPECIES: DUF4189 domain-containing protein [unclassified Xanthomonas]MDY4294899.1 DUF4189 domain-containing protein [Xanthomonas sp. LF02-5]MDY4356603.1 DUF4189 domain-containing protein [Xanthomonas sp. LF04-12]